MSQITTHLLAEDPSVVLIGNNTVFRNQIKKTLQKQGLQVIIIDSESYFQNNPDLEKFHDVYKTIWLYEFNPERSDEYLKILNILKEINSPITIVSSLILNLTKFSNISFQNWKNRSEKQSQFIIDCSFYLPKANFIFGQDVIVTDAKNTSLDFIVENIQKGEIFNISEPLSFIDLDSFIESFKKYLFRPGNQGSILIKSKVLANNLFINLLKKLYDSYHNVNLKITDVFVEISSTVPFSIEIETLNCDERSVVTKIIKSLPFPKSIPLENANSSIEKPDENLKTSKTPSTLKSVVKAKTSSRKRANRVKTVIKKMDLQKKQTDRNRINSVVEKNVSVSPLISISPTKTGFSKRDEELDINSEIQRIFQSSRTEVKVNRIRKIAKSTKKIMKKSKRKRFLFIGGIGMTGAALGVIVLTSIFMISQSILKKELLTSLSKGIIDQDVSLIEENKLKNITSFVSAQVDGYSLVIENNSMTQISAMVDISKDIQLIPQILLEVNETSKNLFLQIVAGDINKTSEIAQILNNKVRLAYEKLSSIQASLDRVDLNIDSNEKENIIERYSNKLREIRSEMSIQQQLQPILPSLTGESSRKTYAVIFQNNQELRPTGGFIQAVALLNFDNGMLISHKVYSVYDLDRKLPGEIIPPADLKKYLGEEKWYLRDSNWNPDFPTTSKQIGWFLNKSLGVDIDGVIATNLFVFKDILKATGPIDLPEYNEVITHKNIFERMEFHSEVVLVDSPNSIDYSVAIFEGLINKIIKVDREKIPTLLSSFKTSLNDNQMLISVLEKSDQSVLNSLGWTGGLIEPQCPTKLSVVDCEVDVFTQVETNIGINKANYYLNRKIGHNIKIDREKVVHKRKIIFKNNAKSNSWPKGTYKSYQRFYIDESSVLDRVLINGSSLISKQISEKKVGGFKEIGIRVDVPIQKQVVVEIEYSTPHDFKDNFSYVFFNQRQPGTYRDSLAVTLEYESDMEPILIAPAAEVYGKTIVFDTDVKNSLFGVEFE